MLFAAGTHAVVEYVLFGFHLCANVALIATLRPDEERNNSFIWFFLIVSAVRFIPLCAVMFAGHADTLADPKKQETAIYFLISITCDGCAAALTDGLFMAKYKFLRMMLCQSSRLAS